MARPIKKGLDYFPLYVDIFEDEKIEAIAGEFGIKGELAVIKLLCAVYKKGYFVVWNDLTQAQLLKRLPGTSKDLLNQIVNRLVAWGFFNDDLFHSAKVLTSETIQANYFEATKRRKGKKATEFILSEVNADINSQLDGVNADINTQIKGNKTKRDESSGGDDDARAREAEPLPAITDESYRRVLDIYEAEINIVNQRVDAGLSAYLERGMQHEVLTKAIVAAADNGNRNWKYVDGILRNAEARGVKTLADWQRDQKRHEDAKQSRSTRPRQSATHKPVITDAEYEAAAIDTSTEDAARAYVARQKAKGAKA